MTLSAQLLLVLSTSAPVFQPPAQPLGVTLDPSPASAVPARDEFDDFKKSFNQARAISAKEEMVRLVKRETTHAVWWIMEIAEGIATRPTDRLVELMADLTTSWQGAIKTNFPDIMYVYFSELSMDGSRKRERDKAKRKYDDIWERFRDNEADKKDKPTFLVIAQQAEVQAKTLDLLGDRYHASDAWNLTAQCYDERLQGDDANFFKATAAYGKSLEARSAIELKDHAHSEIRQRHEYLVAEGYGLTPEEREAKQPKAAEATGAVVAVPLTYTQMASPAEFDRPLYEADDLYPLWKTVNLKGKGSVTEVSNVAGSPKIIRVGSSDVQVDQDGDGVGDIKIPLKGKAEAVTVKLGEGEDQRDWSFFAITGLEKDNYQGLQVNLAPVDDYMTIYILGAGTMSGLVGETPISITDDNLDGIYGSPPMSWGFIGLTEGYNQPTMDALKVEGEKRARPWSEYSQIGDRWYKLSTVNGGTCLEATEATVKTGRLKLSFKGPKPNWVVLQGSGALENSYFDISKGGSKGVEVPAGTYKLYFGEVRKGKKQQTMKSLILPGAKTPMWDVTEGETTVVKLGGPFDLAFAIDVEEQSIKVLGRSVVVTGVSHERYERSWNCVTKAEAAYRKAGAKRGSKGEKMALLSVIDKEWEDAWFPLSTTIEKKAAEADVEVQIVMKKHKLFGKIESSWRH